MATQDQSTVPETRHIPSQSLPIREETGPAAGVETDAERVGGSAPQVGAKRRRSRAIQRVEGEGLRERVYRFGDLSGYTLRERLIIRAADLFFFFLVNIICSTTRWELKGAEHFDSILAGGRRAIITFWHTCIFSGTWVWRRRGIVVMSSRSRDGEFTGRFIKRFGYGTARGSSTRGAGRALAEMAACLKNGIDVAFTIDGPRGPAYVAKAGAVTLARHTGHAILPFHIAAKRALHLPSWDRLEIPFPFTRAVMLVGEPIYVPGEASEEEIKLKQAALQKSLESLRSEAEKMARGPAIK